MLFIPIILPSTKKTIDLSWIRVLSSKPMQNNGKIPLSLILFISYRLLFQKGMPVMLGVAFSWGSLSNVGEGVCRNLRSGMIWHVVLPSAHSFQKWECALLMWGCPCSGCTPFEKLWDYLYLLPSTYNLNTSWNRLGLMTFSRTLISLGLSLRVSGH